ncbi:MAG: hypothetical protein IID40_03680 [Planctomycetes bacterium]|nr:hypothetical protein [Planctomycetota bacterium]
MPDHKLLLASGLFALLASLALRSGDQIRTVAASSGGAGTRMGPARGGCTDLTWDNFAEGFFAS